MTLLMMFSAHKNEGLRLTSIRQLNQCTAAPAYHIPAVPVLGLHTILSMLLNPDLKQPLVFLVLGIHTAVKCASIQTNCTSLHP